MVRSPSLLIHRESQRQQNILNSAHPCCCCSLMGRLLSFLALYMSATTLGRVFWGFLSSETLSAKTGLARGRVQHPQICRAPAGHAPSCTHLGFQAAPPPRCAPLLDAEALPASSARLLPQPVRIAVFLPESMFDLVGELGQDFKPLCDLARGFSSLTQPNQ